MVESPPPEQQAAVARFIERFALQLTEAGMPRMPSRVFTCLLATDSGRLTATELAERLQVSAGAISGAVRYLDQLGMVHKSREPGDRRDHYQVTDDLWYEAYANRDQMFELWIAVMEEGVVAVGPESPAGKRLDATRRFFEFLRKELPALVERWRALEASG